MATIKVKQIKSKIGYPKDQKATLQALGLRKISQVVEVEDTPSNRGMIRKGAKARSGYKRKIGFEGGQMPLQRRVPKAGFKNINHKEYFAVNLSTLQKLAEAKNLTVIGIEELKAAHLTNGKELVKVLGNGELTAKLEVKAHAFSKTAEEAIKAVGGNTTII